MRWPKKFVAPATKGAVERASSISGTLMRVMKMSAPAAVIKVLVLYMMAGPQSIRTAWRSLVARAIRSPVGFSWKNEGACFSRARK